MSQEMLHEEIMEELEVEEMEEEMMKESKFEKAKTFAKKHGKKILVGLGAVTLTALAYAAGKKNGNKLESIETDDLDVIDFNDYVDDTESTVE